MLCITDITVVDVGEDIIRLSGRSDNMVEMVTNDGPRDPIRIATEVIRGQRFRNSRGVIICIGMSQQVREAIGLPFEVYENLQHNLDYEKAQLRQSRNQLKRVKDMTFWERIRFAFTGEIIED